MKDKEKRVLQKIIEYTDNVSLYVKNLDFKSFLQDSKTVSACAFSVLQIGELVKELTEDTLNSNITIPWKSIKGMRNKIVHNYEEIDFLVLWGTIKTSLPELKNQLTELLENN